MNDGQSLMVDNLNEWRSLKNESPDGSSFKPIGISEIIRGRGAVKTLTELIGRLGVAGDSTVCVLADTVGKWCEGEDVLAVVESCLSDSYRVEIVRVAPTAPAPIVHADETTVASAIERVRAGAPAVLVTVGSGTMADIGKVAAGVLDLRHIVVQTAASVNGFADDQSVLLINGAKRTTPSRWPDALIIDTSVLVEAPAEMNRSGLGDQLSMFTAAADWYLSNAVGFDHSYSSTLVARMRRDFDQLALKSSELGSGEPEAVGVLASLLTSGGLAMGMAGRTAPSSGTEHVVSHLLEMHADATGAPSSSHGSTVGVSSVFAALAWQRVRERLAQGTAEVANPGDDVRERVLKAFAHLDDSGATAAECWSAYERKLVWLRSHHDDLVRIVREWPSHDEVVGELLVPASEIASMLARAQAPVDFAQLSPAPDSDVVTWAVANCHLMRDRFTVVDLAELIGAWEPHDVSAMLRDQRELAR